MSDDPGSTGLDIAVTLRDPAWRAAVPRAAALARRAAEAVLREARASGRLTGTVEASLVLADDALVQDLNARYRGRDRPTNVLAFGDWEAAVPAVGPRLLGDVVVARETLLGEAEAAGKRPAEHLTHLIVHGMLHLLGYRHEAEAEAREMETLEVAILSRLGVPDPYVARRPAEVAP